MTQIGGPFKRRVRRPLLSRVKRPVRWFDGGSTVGQTDPPLVQTWSLAPDPSTWPAAGGRELIAGDIDLEWMDKNEVVVERIVGDLAFSFLSVPVPPSTEIFALVRLGILVVEEVESLASWVPPWLFDNEAIEEFEWMWLNQFVIKGDPTVEAGVVRGYENVHIDLRVKRKMGKKDHLVLVGQFGNNFAIGVDQFVACWQLMRVLLKS